MPGTVATLDADINWSDALRGMTTLIHFAARVPVMHDESASPLVEFCRVNVSGKVRGGRSAAVSGVGRFVFVRSTKVNCEDVSSPDLPRLLRNAMGRPARLLSNPQTLLKLAGLIIGKADQADQAELLLGSLQVDSGKIRREFTWNPPHSLQQGLQATVAWN
jgi:nucleoside-diphosphate-sugar epimerase